MTKAEALYKFFSGFGIAAYPDTSVDEDADFPYLTYTPSFDSVGNEVSIPVNLWYRTESELTPSKKAQEIADAIGGGVYVPCDGGAILITKGTPFCQAMMDSEQPTVKRRYINITAEYITLN